MTEVLTRPRVDFDAEVTERLEDAEGPDDYAGWWCIRTKPFPCPAEGCDFVALFVTAAHLIVVFPSKDDRKLLNAALRCREAGRDPRVVPYERDFGPCIAWDRWSAIGRPVHGQLARPDGWDALPRL